MPREGAGSFHGVNSTWEQITKKIKEQLSDLGLTQAQLRSYQTVFITAFLVYMPSGNERNRNCYCVFAEVVEILCRLLRRCSLIALRLG